MKIIIYGRSTACICTGACPGGGPKVPAPPLEIEKQKKKKKGFQILGPPSYEFLDTRLLHACHRVGAVADWDLNLIR